MSNLKFNFIQHEALIDHMEANMFPRKDYDPNDTLPEIQFSEGINHVIKVLKAKLKEQLEPESVASEDLSIFKSRSYQRI